MCAQDLQSTEDNKIVKQKLVNMVFIIKGGVGGERGEAKAKSVIVC